MSRPHSAIALALGAFALLAAPPATRAETNFLSRIRQLTFEGRRAGEGYFSPDGKALIFQSEREPGNPFYQIYILDLETGDSHRVSPGIGKTTCGFFRPGTDEVLFASTHHDPEARAKQQAELDLRASGQQRRYAWDYDETMDIFSARRDGSNLRQLTDAPGYDAEGAYSPDGRLIVFCSLRDAYPTNRLSADDLRRLEIDPSWFGEIYLMNADGSNPRRLTHAPGYDGGPFFSADGRRIVWRRFDEKGTTAEVYTMNLDGSDQRRLTSLGALSWAPYFHPSGDYVIFTSNLLGFGNFELYIVDALGRREPVRVTQTDGFDGLPVFSPDGTRLCWTSARTPGGASQLFLAEWNHEAALRALASAPERAAEPAPTTRSARAPAVTRSDGAAAGPDQSFAREIRAEDLRRQVSFLASPELEGRLTGSPGARRAADYIAEHLRAAGIQPVSGDDFFQEFEYTAGTRLARGNALRVGEQEFAADRDFRPLAFSDNGTISGPVVFAGYGLRVPEGGQAAYDSYAGLDVSNKVVLALRYVPEDVSPERRQELNRYAGLRYKAMIARDLGARAILFVTGPNSPGAGELAPLGSDSAAAGSAILAATVTTNVAAALLEGSGRDLAALQSGLDSESPHAEGGFTVSNCVVHLSVALEKVRQTDRNVLGWIPPSPGTREVVMLGAHYDHLGHGEASGAFNLKGEEGRICPGADDNASGVSLLLEVAAELAAESAQTTAPRRGVVFAFWSGEEMGLLGSSHFADHPLVPLSNVVAYLNFDMVGRMRDNRLILQGVGSSSGWRRMLERRNVAAGFNLALHEDPFLPTDSTAFYPKGVPILAFFTGSHEDYHRPTDVPEKIDYEGLERIARFARRLVDDLRATDTRPDYVEVVRSGGGGSRESLRAYLGTIPDYATEVEGVKFSGVRSGSPADQAGIRGGDVLVEFAGRRIANIYDYTYALDAVKIGEPVRVVVVREGRRVELEVTPTARR